MSKRKPPNSEENYEVGYGKPPKHTRFTSGRSGNPNGRPKGTRNFETDLKATLKAPVRITRNGKPRKVSTQEAMPRQRKRAAVKSHSKARKTSAAKPKGRAAPSQSKQDLVIQMLRRQSGVTIERQDRLAGAFSARLL